MARTKFTICSIYQCTTVARNVTSAYATSYMEVYSVKYCSLFNGKSPIYRSQTFFDAFAI